MSKSPEVERPAASDPLAAEEKGSIWAWVVGALAAAVVLGGVVFEFFTYLTGHGWWPWENTDAADRPDLYEVTRSAVAGAGLIGASIAGALAIRRQRSTERSVRISAEAAKTGAEAQKIAAQTYSRETQKLEMDVVSRLRDRYTTAAGQLGHDSAAVRLAGVYAIATLADEWLARPELTARAEAQTCVELLCGYIRSPRAHGEGASGGIEKAADVEIRQSIIRTIRSRLLADSQTSWQGLDLDFTGAQFDGTFSFDDAEFSGGAVSFDGAVFSSGAVSFDGAVFSRGAVSFDSAVFSGSAVSFDVAVFSGSAVSFYAEFSGGRVSFDRAVFSDGEVSFDVATFSGGEVSFLAAEFIGSEVSFLAATFTKGEVSFLTSQFSGGEVSFDGAILSGGEVSFNKAEFSGSKVSFNKAEFSGSKVSFFRAMFSEGEVYFLKTEFSGGEVSLDETTFSGGVVCFIGIEFFAEGDLQGPWSQPLPPQIWPPNGAAPEKGSL